MSWRCKNDNPSGIEIPAPTESHIVAQDTKYFAKGNAQAILAKGGPGGAFLWAHLHGIHNDRYGETNYSITALVTDDSNYPYMITDILNTTVEGVVDKPERHRHCYATFVPSGEYADFLNLAIENNRPLKVLISGDRDRNDIEWLIREAKEAFNKFAAGQIGSTELLNIINHGEKPPFLR